MHDYVYIFVQKMDRCALSERNLRRLLREKQQLKNSYSDMKVKLQKWKCCPLESKVGFWSDVTYNYT